MTTADRERLIAAHRLGDLSPAKMEAILFEDDRSALGYQCSVSQRAWNAVGYGYTPRLVSRRKKGK